MHDLILINGCGGSGKDTTGRLLLARLKSAALVDIKALIRVEPWEFGEKITDLGVRNAASLITNFAESGYRQIILSGGLATQKSLDLLMSSIPDSLRVHYFWLEVPKSVRDMRRVQRQRDEGDKVQHLNHIDSVFSDPGPLLVSGGNYYRILPALRSPDQIAEEILRKSGIE
jgi:hypothetical protein